VGTEPVGISEVGVHLGKWHQELAAASSSNDNSKVMELSKLLGDPEAEVEKKFERMETAQEELDTLMEVYEVKIKALEG